MNAALLALKQPSRSVMLYSIALFIVSPCACLPPSVRSSHRSVRHAHSIKSGLGQVSNRLISFVA